MFEGFVEETIECASSPVFLRRSTDSSKPALVLLHGYPQTSAMWHRVAPLLCDRYHVVCPDLRGFGRSGKPGTDRPGQDPTHELYSKRAMAGDIVEAMDQLGIERFFLAGHDRGGRVAHRLGMDHPDRCPAICVLDIAPTREMYAATTKGFATAYWHWFFLIQPWPIPEQIIGHDPDGFWLGKNLANAGGLDPFDGDAKKEYLKAFRDPKVIHATCEDYRAAATIDIDHDDADGGRKLSMPLQVLWAKDRVIDRFFDPLALWRLRADIVEGQRVEGSHYFPEEDPERVAGLLANFFGRFQI